MANNALAPKRSNKLYYDDTGASDLDLVVQKQFGLQPNMDRLNIYPYKDPKKGWIAPEWLYQTAKAFAAPYTAYKGGNILPEETANVAMTIGGGGVATGAAAPAPANALGMFIGRRAAQWNPKMLAVAEELERKGATPQEIWQQTGTWRAPDGQWRQEISDEAMAFKNDLYEKTPERKGTIEVSNKLAKETISHPELMTAYPELQNVKTSLTARHEPRTPDYWLSGGLRTTPIIPYFTKAPEYHLNVDAKLKNVAQDAFTHEMQHAVQNIEGFSSGGSPTHYFDEAQAMLEKNPEFNSQHEAIKQMQIIELANQIYRSLAGEAEARAAAVRRNMTSEQRKATFPLESYDIPVSQIRQK